MAVLRIILVLCIILDLMGSVSTQCAIAQAVVPIPKLVISPSGDGLRDLFEHPSEWPGARERTDVILYADHNLMRFNDSDLRAWFLLMRRWNISLELEVGAIKEWAPTAEAAFAAEKPIWDRAISLGANVQAIVMDEPLTATFRLHKTEKYGVQETVHFIDLVRKQYPWMRIGDVEAYPGLPVREHISWIGKLQDCLRMQGTASLDFYRADVDWVSFGKSGIGSWRGVKALAAATHNAGMPFSLIFWASGFPSEKARGITGDDTWYVEVMAQGYAVADIGLRPDQFVLESWISAPPLVIPESEEFSFTRSVLDFANKFVRQDKR